MTRVRVEGFPRLHITLIDVGNATLRRFGGAGIYLRYPGAAVVVERHEVGQKEREKAVEVDRRAEEWLGGALARMSEITGDSYRVVIERTIPAHVGLGSTTALVMSALQGAVAVSGGGVGQEQLAFCSGRGGASGIGVNIFYRGGFVVDGGHSYEEYGRGGYRPSGSGPPSAVPPLLARCAVPTDWIFHLMLPKGFRRSGLAERRLFLEHTPVPAHEVLEVVAAVYHGVLPSVRVDDLELCRLAFDKILTNGFKKVELLQQKPAVEALVSALRSASGYPVLMSSMGPLVFSVSRRADAQVAEGMFRRLCQEEDAEYMGAFSARNQGFALEWNP